MEWTNENPWQGTGVDIETNLSPREIMIKADLDQPLSKNKKLKSRANDKAVRFFKAFADFGKARIVAFGNLEEESILWALAELDAGFTLPGGDTVKGCLLLFSKNDKREKVQIQFMTLRAAGNSTIPIPFKCRAIFSNILLDALKFDDALTQKAIDTCAAGREAVTAFAADAERLAGCKVDDDTAIRFMFDVFQPEDSQQLTSIGENEVEEKAEDKTKKAIAAIKQAPGQELASASMTAWGLLHAVAYTVDHHLGKNPDFRLRQAWFAFNAKVKKRALDLALAML
jgi:uncharacterized protein DUF932